MADTNEAPNPEHINLKVKGQVRRLATSDLPQRPPVYAAPLNSKHGWNSKSTPGAKSLPRTPVEPLQTCRIDGGGFALLCHWRGVSSRCIALMALELPQLPSGLAIDVCFLSLEGRRIYPLQDEEGHTAQKAYGRILRAKGTNPHLVCVRTFRAWAMCWCLPFFLSRARV